MKNFRSEEDFKQKYKDKGGFIAAVNDVKKTLILENDSFSNWKNLFALVRRLDNKDITGADQQAEGNFFLSEEAKIIFALTKLEGKIRADMLKITPALYSSLSEAKKWHDEIIKVIHPDKCKHPLANAAAAQLNDIYMRMKKYGE
ncbi:hypothetical protein QUF76_15290 [Desulfobacterales bacterium HSG16]|nr:hypothetical protein [Desulfobacterales bacterium HSG16]